MSQPAKDQESGLRAATPRQNLVVLTFFPNEDYMPVKLCAIRVCLTSECFGGLPYNKEMKIRLKCIHIETFIINLALIITLPKASIKGGEGRGRGRYDGHSRWHATMS